jgi:hypothetical protein
MVLIPIVTFIYALQADFIFRGLAVCDYDYSYDQKSGENRKITKEILHGFNQNSRSANLSGTRE